MRKTEIRLDTIEQVASTENVSDRVSEKYVPIFTTDIIKTMTPEFEFEFGIRYGKSTIHTVYLTDRENQIAITNSYDRSSALRFSFMLDGLHIPLNLNYQKHIGKNAATLAEDLESYKPAVLEALKLAKITEGNLKSSHILDSFKEVIKNEIFKETIRNKNFISLDLTISDSYNTFYKYIDTIVDRFNEGDYFVTTDTTRGAKVRVGRKIRSRFRKLEVINRINKLLLKEYPEIFV